MLPARQGKVLPSESSALLFSWDTPGILIDFIIPHPFFSVNKKDTDEFLIRVTFFILGIPFGPFCR